MDDGYAHGENGATDRWKVARRDRARDVGPAPRKRDLNTADRDRFRSQHTSHNHATDGGARRFADFHLHLRDGGS